MARKRWIQGKSWSFDSSFSSKRDASIRKTKLMSIGNEVRVRDEGSKFTVLARVKE